MDKEGFSNNFNSGINFDSRRSLSSLINIIKSIKASRRTLFDYLTVAILSLVASDVASHTDQQLLSEQ